jgi:[Skp1-protein]-hydroxyproline N-acetylglucosaminyltransferase
MIVIIFILFLLFIFLLFIFLNKPQKLKKRKMFQKESLIDKEYFLSNINKDNDTLFVSIPSYRDTDCKNTIRDLFNKSTNPELIYVGVFTQNKHESESCKVDIKYKNNIRYLNVDYKEAKGPLYARANIIKKLYNNEKYFIMVDAHTRFVKDWDSKFKHQLDYLKNNGASKPILSTYPPEIKYMDLELNKKNTQVPHICSVVNGDKYPSLLRAYGKQGGAFYKSYFVGAGCLFTYGKFFNEAKLDSSLKHIFNGEEILIAILAYTNGWDIYSPANNIVFHDYTNKKISWFKDNKNTKDFNKDEHESYKKLDEFILTGNTMGKEYSIGNSRPLENYWKELGYNKNAKNIQNKWTKENENIICNKQKNIQYNI